jgi:superfamily II DNA or RNA helicase
MEQTEFYKDGIFYYQGLPDDLDKLKSYKAFNNILSTPLTDEQGVDVLRALFAERYAIFHPTGTGKTYICSGYMKAVTNANPGCKFLMFVRLNQKNQTPKDIERLTGLRTIFYSAETSRLLSDAAVDTHDVILMSHQCLSSAEHMERLSYHIDKFKGIICDEIHLACNIEESSSAMMLYCLSHEVDYFLGLTATPITSDIEQLARVMKVVNPFLLKNFKKIGSELRYYGMGALPKELQDSFSVRDRKMHNISVHTIWIKPMEHQIDAKGMDLFKITKGNGATRQADELVNQIVKRRPFKGLVYVNLSEVYDFIYPYLKEQGIRCAIVNGNPKLKKYRESIIEGFKNGEYDVILTNIKEAVNLDSDYVIFYEFTKHVKQYVGRAWRGLDPKPLDVIYLFTHKTDEFDYFIRNIYCISQEVQEIMNINQDEVLNVLGGGSSFGRI